MLRKCWRSIHYYTVIEKEVKTKIHKEKRSNIDIDSKLTLDSNSSMNY